jgi:orotidine-5'-phosphate decarboxylase
MVTDSAAISKGLNFGDRVRERAVQSRSWLCVGLDPALEKLPSGVARNSTGQVQFCREIISATQHVASAYKINFGFFEAAGPEGWRALETVREAVPAEIPVIADAKRGDISSTGRAYAQAILNVLRFDAVTVNPYLGWDAVLPFASYPGKAAFVLCRTSNPGARDFQDLETDGIPLYMRVARAGIDFDAVGEVALVVGATYPESLRSVRALSQDVILLMPGIGAQGAEASTSVRAGSNAEGNNALAAVSREIIFASPGTDFPDAAAAAAERFAAATWLDDRSG